MVGVLLENGDPLEAVRRSIVGQRGHRVRQSTGLDPLVKGEVCHEVAFGTRRGWSERTGPKVGPEHRHGIEVPAYRQVEHGSARPERRQRPQVHRDRGTLAGCGADIRENCLDALFADIHRSDEGAVRSDALQSLGSEGSAQAVDLVGQRTGHHEGDRQPASWGHCARLRPKVARW